jgi:peptide/nickel transport system substrate-binding protein
MKKIFIAAMAILLVSCLIFGDYGNDAAAQGKEKPQHGGILKEIRTAFILPTKFGWPLSCAGIDLGVAHMFYEGLIKAAPPPEYIEPQLATSWELSSDKKSYTFHLRKGVKFHDGTRFNAQAVKYNFDLVLEKDKRVFKNVTSVEVVDDYTVRMNMSEFNTLLLSDMVMGQGFIASPKAMKTLGEEGMKTNPVGTGPFKIKGFKRGLFLESEKFDDYRQEGLPYLDGIRTDFVKDPMVAMTAFQKGETQLTMAHERDAVELMTKGYNAISCPAVTRTLAPDSRNPDSVFANKLVREAVAYAINRPAYSKALGYGLVKPAYQVANEKSYGYNPALKPREYNPDKAKRLLTRAGYPDGFKITIVCSGRLQGLFEAIQADLAKVGIVAKLKFVDFRAMTKYRLKGGLPTSSLLSKHVMVTAEYAVLLRGDYLSTSPWLPELARTAGLDDLLLKATSAESTGEKVKATQAAIKAMYDDVMVIPVWSEVVTYVFDPVVQNFSFCSVDMNHWWHNEVWLKQK